VISSTVNFSASNPPPTLTQISNLTGAKEDQPLAISFSALSAVADDADKGGSVEGFVVKAVSSGTLKLGTAQQDAAPWAPGTNDRITPTLNAYWTPAANAHGVDANALTAFTVTALDNSNAESTTPIAVKVDVNPVNDAPTISGVPATPAAVNVGVSSALVDFSVADIDSTALTLTLLPVNGTIGSLTDADTSRDGLQLSGSASAINAAVANATFSATTVGSASINLTLEDGGSEVAKATYSFLASKVNSAPSLSTPGSSRAITTGVADGLNYITVSDADTDQILTLSLTPSGGSLRGLSDADLSASGIQLNGTASAINAALAAGSFVASADGAGSISASVSDGVITAPVTATYGLTATNAAPTLTQVSALSGAKEDQAFPISFSDLRAAANEADAGGSVIGFEVTSVDSSKGSLSIGGTAWNATTNKLINTDRKAEWTPAAQLNGTGSNAVNAFSIKAVDDGGLTSNSAVAVSINVTPVNDAPSLSAGSYSFTGVTEDTATAGVSVNTMLASRATDVDSTNLGIAVKTATGLGTWQFSTNNGSSWTNFGAVSATAALLLGNTTQVRYQPNGISGESGSSWLPDTFQP
jgi:hypothetical protein